MSLPRVVLPLVLALAVLGACSSTPPPAAPPAPAPQPAPAAPAAPTGGGLCEQLDAGVVPLQALAAQPGADTDPEGTVRDAVATIREDCPQHTAAADSLAGLLDQQPPASEQDDGGQGDGEEDEQEDPGSAALRACVEQTGQTEAQCREQAASGGAS